MSNITHWKTADFSIIAVVIVIAVCVFKGVVNAESSLQSHMPEMHVQASTDSAEYQPPKRYHTFMVDGRIVRVGLEPGWGIWHYVGWATLWYLIGLGGSLGLLYGGYWLLSDRRFRD